MWLLPNGALSLSVGYAEGPNQKRQILSLKLSWVTPDNDGDPSRLLIHREFDPDSAFSMQYQIEAILTGQEPHEPGTVRILAPQQIFHKRSTSAGGNHTRLMGRTSVPNAAVSIMAEKKTVRRLSRKRKKSHSWSAAKIPKSVSDRSMGALTIPVRLNA